MDKQDSSLSNDIQELINKSIEVNKLFLSETSKLVRNIATPGEKKTSTVFQTNFFTEAFNAYAKMNIQHMKNMLDLGASLVKSANTQQSPDASVNTNTETTTGTETAEPSFILSGDVAAGNKIAFSFLLDNSKPDAVLCTLINSSYTYQADTSGAENFTTIFSPQSFMLNTGEQKRINIDIDIPAGIKPGLYTSNVQVQGFEPAYFSILLTVNETPNKTAANASKTKKSQQ